MNLKQLFKSNVKKAVLVVILAVAVLSYFVYSNSTGVTGLSCDWLGSSSSYCFAVKENNPDACYSSTQNWAYCSICGKNISGAVGRNETEICRNVAPDFSSCEVLNDNCRQFFKTVNAIEINDSNACGFVTDSGLRDKCISTILRNETMGVNINESGAIEATTIFVKSAVPQRNQTEAEKLCEKIIGADVTQYCIAVATFNEGLCETINVEPNKRACFFAIGSIHDKRVCNKVDDGMLRVECYYHIPQQFVLAQ